MTSQPTASPQRRTRQRAAVQDVLAELHEFRTAQQIHDELRNKGDSIGLQVPKISRS